MKKEDWSAAQIIEHLPQRFKAEESIGYEVIIHFQITGNHVGEYSLQVKDGLCTVSKGLMDAPNCVIKSSAVQYELVEKGKKNHMVAIMAGDIKVSNMIEMMSFSQRFYGLFSSKIK